MRLFKSGLNVYLGPFPWCMIPRRIKILTLAAACFKPSSKNCAAFRINHGVLVNKEDDYETIEAGAKWKFPQLREKKRRE